LQQQEVEIRHELKVE